MLPEKFEPFVKDSPFSVMVRGTLESLFRPEEFDQLFDRTARRQYTKKLLFSQLTELMLSVVMRRQPSVHAAYKNGVGNSTVSDQSIYDKLDHVELGVSAALVGHSAGRVAPVLDELPANGESPLPGRRVRILDGNYLGGTQRRLEVLRPSKDAPLPGKVLAIMDQPSGLVTDAVLTPDGHASERSLLGEVLERVSPGEVWVADRDFRTLGMLFGIEAAGACFVIRQHGQIRGELLGERRHVGRSETGEVYEQTVELSHEGRARVFRRVTVELDEPTEDGDTRIHILTNLPSEEVDGVKVSEVYRGRWSIEGLFYRMTQTSDREPSTLGYPKAALFAFRLALVASNAVTLIKAALRAEHGEKAEEVSDSYVALEVRQTHRGMMVALPGLEWEVFARMSAAELAGTLRRLAGGIDPRRYRKAKRGPKKPAKPKKYRNGGHVSTHGQLNKRKV